VKDQYAEYKDENVECPAMSSAGHEGPEGRNNLSDMKDLPLSFRSFNKNK
jgi:hypothetical protein